MIKCRFCKKTIGHAVCRTWFLSILLAFFALVATGCSADSEKSTPITIDSLPGNIAYKDTTINLSAVSFCEVYTNHGYTGYSVVTIDRHNFSDDEVYWMLNRQTGEMQEELEVVAYISSSNNDLSSERLSLLKTVYDSENIYFIFYTKSVQREHLNDFQLSLQIIVSPEKSLTASSTQYYYYHKNAEEDVDYSDYDSLLTQDEINALLKALNAQIDSLS